MNADEGSAEDALLCSPTPTFVLDEAGRVRRANMAGEALATASERVMRGRPLDDFLRFGEPAAALGARAEAAPFFAFDRRIELAQGPARDGDVAVAPLSTRPGWRVVAVHARPAPRRPRVRRPVDAAAVLAHEIKNPLSGIRGAAQLIEGAGEGGEMPRLIRQEVDRIAALLDRMEGLTDTRPLDCGPLNIHAVLRDVAALARQGYARDVAIDEAFDPSLPAVLGERDALVQLFTNLLKNAVEAAPRGPVQLRTAYRYGVGLGDGAGGRVALPIEAAVIDDGPGLPSAVAAALFTPFVTTKLNGSGLGLALADKLAADLGGVLEHARNEAAGRTIFRVRLRRAGADR
ncbi:MAG: Nitrogen regulation protein NtrB [uncultured Sphingomonadaceae bacterium]|uniref:histidine kinase n=1 Tax=uncultured Sphingomonadaceae bacterium TaxID=169976 RepID=A0A6J4THB1_9SPHN|nr:MAG: Nitrogen regulation protein NtrB [uncultured Sphingomonadaceae bacterium]